MSKPLYLPDLTITGFRGIGDLRIPHLGRVTLLAGKNGVGKTTVLDAVRVFAFRGRYSVLEEVLRSRQEVSIGTYEDGETETNIRLEAIFFGRTVPQDKGISIGPTSGPLLSIGPRELTSEQADRAAKIYHYGTPTQAVAVEYEGNQQILWPFLAGVHYQSPDTRRLLNPDIPPPEMSCIRLGPNTLSESYMSRLWDRVALTEGENQIRSALNIIHGDCVEQIAMVGDIGTSDRIALVRLNSCAVPIPLKSLGDGAVRLFGIALALWRSHGGFLLIDEAENGLHHSAQYDLWRMILRTAQTNDVQVLATTHSWDCVRGFAYAATEFEDDAGLLVRLDRDDRGLRAVEYSQEDLKVAADQGIEVR